MKKLLNIIKNPKIIFVKILNSMHFLPDTIYLKIRYFLEFGKKLNLKNPKTFNEKLNWLKINDRNPEYNKLVDKYLVREYISNTIGEEYLIPLLGVWDSFDEIDFDSLPEQFVLKCTHDSGSVVICKDKNTFDYSAAKAKIERKLKKNMYWWAREWVYKNLKPRIIAEQYMEDSSTAELRDYKFFAFNGEAKMIFVASERQNANEETKFDFFDMEYNHLDFTHGHPNAKSIPEKPEQLDKMRELTEILSKGFPHVRVDFYYVEGKIYFGEITFYHNAGLVPFTPEEWDLKLGNLIDLTNLPEKIKMKKIKILHVITSFASGGAERVVLGYMKDFMNDKDIEMHALALGTNKGSIFDEEIEKLKLNITYANIDITHKFVSVLIMKAIRKAVKELKPDIVHSHLRLLPHVTFATFFQKKLKRIHTIHAVPEIISAGRIMRFDKFCFQKMQVLPICLNRELAKQAEQLYEIPFCEFLYNGIEISNYTGFSEQEALRKQLGIPQDAYVVGHVGRFVPIKNHDFLIDVFYEVKKKKPNSYLLLVGEGPEMTAIREKCKKLKLEDSVIFAGTCSNANELLQVMNGYIFPSKTEGLGISLIEAQAAGLRCVVSDTIPEEAYVKKELISLSLNESPKKWCEVLLSDIVSTEKRNDLEEFSIRKINDKLKKCYITMQHEG